MPNDFLPILSSHHLEYATFFSDAESQGALAWGLCGSGSALFALFPDAESLFSLQRFLTDADWIEKYGCWGDKNARTEDGTLG